MHPQQTPPPARPQSRAGCRGRAGLARGGAFQTWAGLRDGQHGQRGGRTGGLRAAGAASAKEKDRSMRSSPAAVECVCRAKKCNAWRLRWCRALAVLQARQSTATGGSTDFQPARESARRHGPRRRCRHALGGLANRAHCPRCPRCPYPASAQKRLWRTRQAPAACAASRLAHAQVRHHASAMRDGPREGGGAQHRARQGVREQKLRATHSWHAQQIRGVFHGQHGVAIEAAMACHDGEPTGRPVGRAECTPAEALCDVRSMCVTGYWLLLRARSARSVPTPSTRSEPCRGVHSRRFSCASSSCPSERVPPVPLQSPRRWPGAARQSATMMEENQTMFPLQLQVAPDKNDPAPLILYHGRNCPDGFGAALAAWLYYGEIHTVNYLPPVRGRPVYILDFSFAPAVLRAIDKRAAKLVLLDHHKSAA